MGSMRMDAGSLSHGTDDRLNFIGSNIAWGEPVGKLPEGNVPGVKLGAGLLSRST